MLRAGAGGPCQNWVVTNFRGRCDGLRCRGEWKRPQRVRSTRRNQVPRGAPSPTRHERGECFGNDSGCLGARPIECAGRQQSRLVGECHFCETSPLRVLGALCGSLSLVSSRKPGASWPTASLVVRSQSWHEGRLAPALDISVTIPGSFGLEVGRD